MPRRDQRWDVVIVGAGSAGATLATRLSEDPNRRVLLIEAGPHYSDIDQLPAELRNGRATELDPTTQDHNWVWEAKSNSRHPGPIILIGGRVTGGGSAVNGQAFLRGLPEDFDSWVAHGAVGWAFDQVLPYFIKMETDHDFSGPYHGASGPVPVRRFAKPEWLPLQSAFVGACNSAGFPLDGDLNSPDSTGAGPYPLNNMGGIRMSTALCYLGMAARRPNLKIVPQTTIERVIFDRSRAVEVMGRGPLGYAHYRAEQVVLSAGAIGSPRLLILSGIGPEAEVRRLGRDVVANLPGVGSNLRDHPQVRTTWKAREEAVAGPDDYRFQVCVRYTSPGSTLRNDMKITASSYSRVGDDAVDLIPALQLATGSGAIRFLTNRVEDAPLIECRFLEGEEDRRRLREAVRTAVELAHSAELRDLIVSPIAPTSLDLLSDDSLDSWLWRNVRSSMHMSATCSMGSDRDEFAVCDPQGRVRGVEGLRVVDASIMPDCIRANTNATTIMIAERIADLMQS